jgi:hypothetical protein
MRKTLTLTVLFTLFISFCGKSQTTTTVSESRKENLKSILNYRYKGGFYTLEKDFAATVTFPESAKMNCRLGICVASVTVDCKGVIQEVTLKNPLRLGIDEEITNFFNGTSGKWNNCDDDKYTRFEIPIQFTIDGTITNSTDALLICVGEHEPGQLCNPDEYYLKKAQKYMEKKNGKKALPYINVLIQRDPYNNTYMEMKREAINYLDKKNK